MRTSCNLSNQDVVKTVAVKALLTSLPLSILCYVSRYLPQGRCERNKTAFWWCERVYIKTWATFASQVVALQSPAAGYIKWRGQGRSMEAADWTEVTLLSCEAGLRGFGEIFPPPSAWTWDFCKIFTPSRCELQTTKSNICLDLENFCLEFCC